jgi:hypothetical protein
MCCPRLPVSAVAVFFAESKSPQSTAAQSSSIDFSSASAAASSVTTNGGSTAAWAACFAVLPPWVRVALGSLMHVGTLVPSSATKIVRPGREVASVGAGASGLDGPVFPTSCARAGLLVAAAREGRVAVWGAPCSEACRRGHRPAASLFLPPPTATATRLSVASGCQEPAAREAAGALLSPPRRPGKRKTLQERQWRGRPAQNYFNLFFDGSGVGNRSINLTQLLPV